MVFIRRVRTASGATAVQIAEYRDGRKRIVKHVGSAHTEVELGILMARARELLEPSGQDAFDLDVEARPPVAALLEPGGSGQPDLFAATDTARGASSHAGRAPARAGAARVVATDTRVLFEALAGVYTSLGFDAVGDAVFRDLVIARIVEATSLLDCARVLIDLGRRPASYATMKRTLTRAVTTTTTATTTAEAVGAVGESVGSYRDRVARLCFDHAVSSGDVSLCLYDVTVRHEALVVRVEVRDHHRGSGRSRGREAGGSLTGETTGRVGAALTKPCRVSTVGWRGRGERAEEVYARNRCHHLS